MTLTHIGRETREALVDEMVVDDEAIPIGEARVRGHSASIEFASDGERVSNVDVRATEHATVIEIGRTMILIGAYRVVVLRADGAYPIKDWIVVCDEDLAVEQLGQYLGQSVYIPGFTDDRDYVCPGCKRRVAAKSLLRTIDTALAFGGSPNKAVLVPSAALVCAADGFHMALEPRETSPNGDTEEAA